MELEVIPHRWMAAPCYGAVFSLPVPGLVSGVG
jgi:hypothetical protein